MSRRTCTHCGRLFDARLPGSGLKASLCSVDCERGERQQKANSAARRRTERQQRTRQSSSGETVGWPLTVFELYGYDCLSCGMDAQEAHHIVGRSHIANAAHLSTDLRTQLEFDPANGFPICQRCHEVHTNGVQRIYWQMIPAGAVAWALANGFASRIMDDRIYLGAPAPPNQEAA